MPRAPVLVTLITALLLAAPAFAGLSDWNGEVEPGGFMAFDEKNGGKAVKGFDWSEVPIDCETGLLEDSAGEIEESAMKVKHKRFKGTDHESGYTEKVKGRFVAKHESEGTLRVKGDIEGATECDTGKVNWEASDL